MKIDFTQINYITFLTLITIYIAYKKSNLGYCVDQHIFKNFYFRNKN